MKCDYLDNKYYLPKHCCRHVLLQMTNLYIIMLTTWNTQPFLNLLLLSFSYEITIYTHTDTWWKIRGSNSSRDEKLSSSPKLPDWLWGPPCLLFSRYRDYCRERTDRGVRLTNLFHLLPTLRMSGFIPLLPLHAFMAWTGTLPFNHYRNVYYDIYLE
jgi:hypothetical protein